jgi:hypothetical protein
LRVTIAKSGPGLITASKVMVMTAINSAMALPVVKVRNGHILLAMRLDR